MTFKHLLSVEYTPWLFAQRWAQKRFMLLRRALAKNLQRLRLERGLSQEAFADRAGIDRTYVSALERQIYAATIDMIERLAEALSVDPLELLANESIVTQDDETGTITVHRPKGRPQP